MREKERKGEKERERERKREEERGREKETERKREGEEVMKDILVRLMINMMLICGETKKNIYIQP